MFRVFDPTTAEVVFWGERYPLKTIMDEVTRLYPLARAQGGMRLTADGPHESTHEYADSCILMR